MTETQRNRLRIPSRKEFHRYASNLLCQSDFDTDYPSGFQVARVTSAISWTYANDKQRTSNYNDKDREDK